MSEIIKNMERDKFYQNDTRTPHEIVDQIEANQLGTGCLRKLLLEWEYRIQSSNQRLKEAEKIIAYYGEEDNWFQDDDYYGETIAAPVCHDNGDKAREYQAKHMKDGE